MLLSIVVWVTTHAKDALRKGQLLCDTSNSVWKVLKRWCFDSFCQQFCITCLKSFEQSVNSLTLITQSKVLELFFSFLTNVFGGFVIFKVEVQHNLTQHVPMDIGEKETVRFLFLELDKEGVLSLNESESCCCFSEFQAGRNHDFEAIVGDLSTFLFFYDGKGLIQQLDTLLCVIPCSSYPFGSINQNFGSSIWMTVEPKIL
mmetsp:Transcript_16827/g.32840  ORF Transcript_16827/g.32840 Transcript_16827/m.32840 type:complete len:202 (-) Transcript_16827:331-936(-)